MERLLKLQGVDNQIRFLKEAKVARPRELDTDRRKLEQAQARVDAVTLRIQEGKLAAARGEREVKECDEEIRKTRASLHQAKTNDEYAVLKAQIEKIAERRSGIEEAVLAKLDELDRLARDLESEKARLAEEEVSFNRKKGEVDEIVASLDEKLEKAQADRARLASEVDPDHLSIYDRVLERWGNTGIAVVRDSVCQGCYMKVNNQEINLLMSSQELVRCRSCSRLLYLE